MLELGEAFFKAHYKQHFEFDPDKIEFSLRALLPEPRAFLRVGGDETQLTWVFGGVVSPSLFYGDEVASELFFFCEPTAKSRIPVTRLMNEFEAWASTKGVTTVCFTLLGTDPKDSFLHKRGYTRTETTYAKVL